MPCALSTSPRPIPDSSSSCGEATAPADRITSPAASARAGLPWCQKAIPLARLPSKTIRAVWAWVSTVRLGRAIAGLRKPSTTDQRVPRRWLTWKKAEPSLVPVL